MSRRRKADPTCPYCGEYAHEGYVLSRDGMKVDTPQEALAEIDPDAAVFFDRDVVVPGWVEGMCGPRLRRHATMGLLAHFGSPAGPRYVIFGWVPKKACWERILDTKPPKHLQP